MWNWLAQSFHTNIFAFTGKGHFHIFIFSYCEGQPFLTLSLIAILGIRMGDKKFTFLNRDLSWLSFNHRVLMEAADPNTPLYSRISFLSIFSSNLDEFFRVRMPAIFAFTSIKAKKTSLRDEYPKDLVQQVQTMIQMQLEQFGSILSGQIIPLLLPLRDRNHTL